MAKGFKTGGRTAGTLNKATAECKEIAGKYGPAAMRKLAKLAGLTRGKCTSTEQTQAAACRDIVERWAGKPTQSIEMRYIRSFEDLDDAELDNLARGGQAPVTKPTKPKAGTAVH